MEEDTLASWFLVEANRDHFTHISHTFTHENLDNATYSDTNKEIQFNQAWLKAMGISAGKFASQGLIPPGITGLHVRIQGAFSSYLGGVSREVPLNTLSPSKPFSPETSALSRDMSWEQKLQSPTLSRNTPSRKSNC